MPADGMRRCRIASTEIRHFRIDSLRMKPTAKITIASVGSIPGCFSLVLRTYLEITARCRSAINAECYSPFSLFAGHAGAFCRLRVQVSAETSASSRRSQVAAWRQRADRAIPPARATAVLKGANHQLPNSAGSARQIRR